MKIRSITLGAAVALLGLVIAPVLTASAASAAPANGGGAYTCTGGNVPPGSYPSILVTGLCYMPAGTIVVRGNVTVAPGALLDAGATPDDPAASPVVTATVRIGGNVFVGKGAVLVLGCSPNLLQICPRGLTFDSIGGNLTAVGALADVIHGTSIGGSVSIFGGGGGAAGGAASGGCFDTAAYPIPAPWSEDAALVNAEVPEYTDFEDSSIGGNLTVVGVQTCWMGAVRVLVGGGITFSGDVTSDPDGMEIDNNLTGGNLTCLNNDPAVQFGDSAAAPNMVRGLGVGECGFGVVLPNPAPEAGEGTGTPEHIAVSTSSLKTYFGTHTSTSVASLPPVTTESGYVITGNLNDFTVAGSGLTGSGTYTSSLPPGESGDAVISTVYPNGSQSFIAYDTCNCSFGGQSGPATMRFYGTSAPNGSTYGTFLITSGGAVIGGGLQTLAGWGTFYGSSPTGTWRLVEYLRIT
jgi:hypothetical protein